MMEILCLKLTLISDATFGRGDGVAGLVDAEVEHDRSGLPYLRGRTLKGLLAEECANILFALEQCALKTQLDLQPWRLASHQLFGSPGSTDDHKACLHVGDARLPDDLCSAVIADLDTSRYTSTDVLNALTALRHQTAMDESGVPEKASLRTMRVILRETPFTSELRFAEGVTEDALALLSACVQVLRRVGTGRNRGRGCVEARLCTTQGQDVTRQYFVRFRKEVGQ